MSDVVRTSCLSKFWRNRWTIIPSLNFENNSIEFHKTDELRKFICRALILWHGESDRKRVQKFKFETSIELKKLIYADIDLRVLFAMNHQVEELYLHMLLESYTYGDYDPKEGVYSVPQCLYSPCSSLKVLSIKHCQFTISRNVQWNQLKHLTITQGLGLTENVIKQILSGSLKLEVLILSFVESGANLTIESKSLKELSVHKYLFDHSDLSEYSVLKISAPKLENLMIEGTPYSECLLEDVASLTHATLHSWVSGLHDDNWDEHLGLDFEDEDEDEHDYNKNAYR